MKKTIPILLLLAASIAAYFVFNIKQQNQKPKNLPSQFKLGVVSGCRKIPQFIKRLNMRQPAIDSKQLDHNGGLLIRDMSNNATWQDKSWTKSGYLAAFERDDKGSMYVAPLPYVSLTLNPPEKQNQIYKIDTKSAKMNLFLKMPSPEVPNNKNPFGTMGLFYDCDTNSLYVTSVAGSLPKQEKGVIYQIDLTTNQVVSQLNNVDAIGVGVFNTLKGKKLYFGSARKPHIYSVYLDEKGHFVSNKKYELSLSEIQGGNTTVAKKFVFRRKNNKFIMTVKETEFGFRLLAENNPNKKKYHFEYSIADDKWAFLAAEND
jgi:hypothetical protein